MLQHVSNLFHPGQIIAKKFQIKKFLGRGGMGAVYLAIDQVLDRQVALKIPLPEFAHDPKARHKFIDEARKTARLEHPNIVPIYEANEDNSLQIPYLVMQYLGGGTLRERIHSNGMMLEEAISLFAQACKGVFFAHQNRIHHRDLSPENLMFDQAGIVKITDFGLAKLVENIENSKTGQFIGKPAYMSPEQWGVGTVDHRTDIYALGIIFYEMLTGTTPFKGKSPAEYVSKHLYTPPPLLRNKTSKLIPDWIQTIISKALAKDKNSRYQDANEIATILRKGVDDINHTSSLSPLPPIVAQDAGNSCTSCQQQFDTPAPGNRCPICGAKITLKPSNNFSSNFTASFSGYECLACRQRFENIASGSRCPNCGSKVLNTGSALAGLRSGFECHNCKRKYTQASAGNRCPHCGIKL